MKRKSIIITAVLLTVMIAPLWAQNEDIFEVKQNVDNTITITGFNGSGNSRFKGQGELVIPSTLYGLKVTAIGDYAFGFYTVNINKFTSVVIPDTVISIGKSAFEGQGLTSVNLGKGVRTIGEAAFASTLLGSGKNKLKKIDIPNSVIEIGASAFGGNLLTEVIIPASVRKIGEWAFTRQDISTVVIPASLSPGTNGQLGSKDFRVFTGSLNNITLPAGMDTEIVKANFGESLANFYVSQGRTAGIYLKNGPIWVKGTPAEFAARQEMARQQAQRESAAKYFYSGKSAHDKGDYDKAIADYTQAIRIDPYNDTYKEYLGYAQEKKTPQQAQEAARQAAAQQEAAQAAQTSFNRGKSAHDKGDYDKAIAAYTEAVRLDPNNNTYKEALKNAQEQLQQQLQQQAAARPYFNSGEAAYGKRDYDKAIAAFTEAIRLIPLSPTLQTYYYSYRMRAYIAKKDYDKAIADGSEMIRLEPSSLNYGHRADAYKAKGDYDKAIADYTEAIRLDPNNNTYKEALRVAQLPPSAQTYYVSGQAAFDKRDYDKAIADYTEAIRLARYDSDKGTYFSFRASAYKSKGDYDKAIADYTEAIRLDPNTGSRYSIRAQAYMEKKDYDRAIADYTEAIRLDPNTGYIYTNRASVYRAKGDYDKAIADHTEAIRLDPNTGYIYYTNRASVYIAKKDYDKAIADCNEAIRLNPNHTNAYSGRAQAYIGKRKYKEARADVNKSLQLAPNYQRAKDLDAELKNKGY